MTKTEASKGSCCAWLRIRSNPITIILLLPPLPVGVELERVAAKIVQCVRGESQIKSGKHIHVFVPTASFVNSATCLVVARWMDAG